MNSVGRIRVWETLALLAFAALPLSATRGMLATAASTLFESTPFILAGVALAAVARRPGAAALLGCGCGTGPSARSLPAALATAMVFGPAIAAVRFAAAWPAARLLGNRAAHGACAHRDEPLMQLRALLVPAVGASMALHVSATLDLERLAPLLQGLGGAAIAFVAAPCALGAVAFAGALHARSALAAAGFLAVAGIADVRALAGTDRGDARGSHDALAYALAAIALAVVASRGGDALVHPAFAIPLALAAVASGCAAIAFRRQSHWKARIAPCVMLAGSLLGAPAPAYHATETTLDGLFAGERLTFTGVLVRERGRDAVVRYAITCCRADAAPVAVRLARAIAQSSGTWVRVDGPVVAKDGTFELEPESATRVAAPLDPFVYR